MTRRLLNPELSTNLTRHGIFTVLLSLAKTAQFKALLVPNLIFFIIHDKAWKHTCSYKVVSVRVWKNLQRGDGEGLVTVTCAACLFKP